MVAQIQGAPNATYQQMEMYGKQMFDAAASLPEYYGVFQSMGRAGNNGFGGVLFKPWGERKRNADELQKVLQERWNHIAGAQIAAFQLPALPGSQGLPRAVRHHDHRAAAEPVRGDAEAAGAGQGQRHVLLHRFGYEDRQAPGDSWRWIARWWATWASPSRTWARASARP